MRRMAKKIGAVLLSLCVMLSVFMAAPVSVLAAGTLGGSGHYLADRTVDPATSTPPTSTGGFGTKASDGRIWTDKTVTVNSSGSFDVKLSALAQQYVSTRASGSSGSGGDSSVAADVIFILDMSTSMYAGDVAKPEGESGNYIRVEAMVRATNHAIKIIMDANPNNRVAVHWFGGGIGTSTHVGTFMELDAYTTGGATTAQAPVPDEDYLRWGGTVNGNNNRVWTSPNLKNGSGSTYNSAGAAHGASANWGSTNPGGSAKAIASGTPTQSGVTYGIQKTIKQITDVPPTGTRQPFVFLLSDGAAIAASSRWDEMPSNPANASSYVTSGANSGFWDVEPSNVTTTGDKSVAALTILTAAYQKQLLTEAYASYSGGAETLFYSVGLGSDDAINGTTATRYAWCALNPGGLVTEYDTGTGNTNNSPTSTVATNTKMQMFTYQSTAANTANRSGFYNGDAAGTISDTSNPGKFTYASYYKYANTYPLLDEAFEKLSEDVAAATEVVELPVETDGSGGSGSVPNAIIFTDEVGAGMEAGVPKIGTTAGTTTDTGTTKTYTFANMESTAVYATSSGVTTITWNVAAADMAKHMYTYAESGSYTSAQPITMQYTVGLASSVSGVTPTASPTTTAFYSNAHSSGTAKAAAAFTPTGDNPYYYYTSTSVGEVGSTLAAVGHGSGQAQDNDINHFVQGDLAGAVSAGATLTSLYITKAMVDASAGSLSVSEVGTVKASYTVPSDAAAEFLTAVGGSICNCETATTTSGAGGYAFLAGILLSGDDSNLKTTAKTTNTTATAAYASSDSITNGKVTTLLGNNGKLLLAAGIAKAAPTKAAVGQTITYTITVYNYSAEALTGVVVKDTPFGVSNVTNTTTATGVSYSAPNWTIASLGAGSSVTITFTGTVTASSGSNITNTASITSANSTTVSVASNQTTTPVYSGTAVVIGIDKDDAAWETGDSAGEPPAISLVPSTGGGAAVTDLTDVPDGTYKVYDGDNDTGKTITVDHAASGDKVTGNGLELDYYTLTVTCDSGCDDTSGGGIYLAGTEVDIDADLLQGYSFNEWSVTAGSGTLESSCETKSNKITVNCTLTVAASTTVNDDIGYKVHHWVMDTTGVYVLVSTDELTGYTDDVLTLATQKKSAYEVTGGITYKEGEVGAGSSGATSPVASAVVTADGLLEISLYYQRAQYTLTLDTGEGIDSITTGSGGTYYYGEEIPLEAAVTPGYDFGAWVDSGGPSGNVTDNPAAYTMPARDVTLTATGTPAPVDHDPINPPGPDDAIPLGDEIHFVFPGRIENLKEILFDGIEYDLQGPNPDGGYDLHGPNGGGPVGKVTVDEGGNIVATLDKGFLGGLPDGQHTVEVVFDDGGVVSSGSLTFMVRHPAADVEGQPSAPTGSPKTGDRAAPGLYVLAAAASLAGLALCGFAALARHKNDVGRQSNR